MASSEGPVPVGMLPFEGVGINDLAGATIVVGPEVRGRVGYSQIAINAKPVVAGIDAIRFSCCIRRCVYQSYCLRDFSRWTSASIYSAG
jgi:hypothetical protein